jgi:osmoprotectant transport system ATP-binding protein
VPSDQITVIVGPSGCGKTTTLRMVNRMLEPTTGRITWDGTALRSKRKTTRCAPDGLCHPERWVVSTPQRPRQHRHRSSPLALEQEEDEKRALELLDSVGLDRKLADRYPVQLSGGNSNG